MERPRRRLFWCGAVAGFVLPLVISPWSADIYFLPKLVVAWLVVIGMLIALGVEMVRGRLRLRRTPLDIPLALVVLSALLSTPLATNRNLAFFGSYGRYEGFLTILLYALLFWLTSQTLRTMADARIVLRTLLAAAFIVSLITVIQVAAGSLGGVQPGETAFSFGGVLRGYATFGNPNALGAFLAMLLPLATWEVLRARSASGRWLAANLVVVMALALLVTFSRSSWLGAGLGVALVVLFAIPRRARWTLIAAPVVAGLLVLGGSRLGGATAAPNVFQAATERAQTAAAPLGGSSGEFRVHVWADTLRLIASRPLTGYGPDSFGLVYPRFQSGTPALGVIVDRPHSEPLGIAATQGLLGLAAYLLLLAAVVGAFWRSRRDLHNIAIFGGVVASLTYLLFNFSWLPSSLPLWIFLAAAVTAWRPPPTVELAGKGSAAGRLAGGLAILAAAVALVPLVVSPYRADITYRAALDAAHAGHRQQALRLISDARSLAPWQSTYAVAQGTLALDLQANGQPGRDADWIGARRAFLDAARLGTFIPGSYRDLAIAEAALGDRGEAIAAARLAVELNSYDPANQAELARLLAG